MTPHPDRALPTDLYSGEQPPLISRQTVTPTNDLLKQRLHFCVASFAIPRAHQIWRRQYAQLLPPVSPRDFQGVFRSPSAPLHIRRVGRVETWFARVPPIPDVRPALPPLL